MTATLLVAYGLLSTVIEPLVWGIAVYALWFALGHTRGWVALGVVGATAYFLYEEVVLTFLLSRAGMVFTDPEVVDLIGASPWELDWVGVFTAWVLPFGSVWVGSVLVGRCCTVALRRLRAAPMNMWADVPPPLPEER